MQVSRNQLFGDHGYWNVSHLRGRLDILHPKESLGILRIPWVFVDLVQTSSYTMPAFLEASVKSYLIPLAAFFLISQPIRRIRHTKHRHKISQGDFSLFSTMDCKAFVLLCSQASLTTMVAKKNRFALSCCPGKVPSYTSG